MKSDEHFHWYECTVCGQVQEKAEHIPGSAPTEDHAQVCTVCGYEIAPKLEPTSLETAATSEETEATPQTAENETSDPNATIGGENPAAIETEDSNAKNDDERAGASPLPWILGVGGVLAVGGVAAFVIKRKK